LPLKKAAQIKEVDSRIDNNDELFSIDARNPNVLFNFTYK
jgi:hypothetical protein